ncbi:MAG: PfkB family carbohydrate kinase, partial [Albidovulum sp.]|uniref:PfkB family carbohydrate kinase n=1 Tax=Albidovulum sp. TaxID=1872424 RepID=UPI003CA08E33
AKADLRLASAGAGKAARLARLLGCRNVTFYLNLEEAGILAGRRFADAATAAAALLAMGAARVLVTDGAGLCADGQSAEATLTALPPKVAVHQLTGAGDTFMAAHIRAEQEGHGRAEALRLALAAAGRYVSRQPGPGRDDQQRET